VGSLLRRLFIVRPEGGGSFELSFMRFAIEGFRGFIVWWLGSSLRVAVDIILGCSQPSKLLDSAFLPSALCPR